MSAGGAGPPPGARLLLTRSDGSLQELPLARAELLVGRGEEADVLIDEPLVSREHARLVWQDGAFVVIDLGSTNQTRVNGERVLRARLEPGDELRFARAVCRYELPSGGPGAQPNSGESPRGPSGLVVVLLAAIRANAEAHSATPSAITSASTQTIRTYRSACERSK